MSKQSDVFDYTTCRFEVEKSKEATSRVVLWHEYGLVNSFTLESSYCGPNQGDQKVFCFTYLRTVPYAK